MQDGAPIIIKKVKKGGHGHHGGAWKVALADFMTAMMAFFLVMWITGLSQEERSLIQAYFNDPIGITKTPPKNPVNLLKPSGPKATPNNESGSTLRKLEQIQKVEGASREIKKALEADPELKKLETRGSIDLRMTEKGLVLEFIESEKNGEVFFELGQADVRPGAKVIIAKVARLLAKIGRPIQIQGHTDARPMNRAGYDNFDLSHDRANVVRRLMTGAGVDSAQILAVEALADSQPRVPGNRMDFRNRRVSVLLPYSVNDSQLGGLPADGFREEREAHFTVPNGIGPAKVDLSREKPKKW